MSKTAEQCERELVVLILKEHKRRMLTAVGSLWRIGDAVRRLKGVVETNAWGRTLESCALQVEMHPDSLDEVARAAEAFSAAERRRLRQGVKEAGLELTPSHVITLARVSPWRRARGVDALLKKRHSVQELRSYLRGLAR